MKWEVSFSTKRLLSQLEELECFWAEVSHRLFRRKEKEGCLKQKKASLLSARSKTAKNGYNGLSSSPVYREEASDGPQCSPIERLSTPSSSKQVSSLRHVVMASRKQKENAQVPSESTVDNDKKATFTHRKNSFSPYPAKKVVSKDSVTSFSSTRHPSTSPNTHCAQESFVRDRSRGGSTQARSPHGKDARRRSSHQNFRESPEKQKKVVQEENKGKEQLKNNNTRAGVVKKASEVSLCKQRGNLCRSSLQRQGSKVINPKRLSIREQPSLPSFSRRSSLPKGFKVYNAEEMDVLIVTPLSRTIVSSNGSWNAATPSVESKMNNPIFTSSNCMLADSHQQIPAAAVPARSPHTPPESNSSSCLAEGGKCIKEANSNSFIRPKIISPSNEQIATIRSPCSQKGMRSVRIERKDNSRNTESEELVCCQCGQKGLLPGSNFCINCGSALR